MTYDLIIIGAGINGAGLARDAALRGLSVLVIDKGDIGGGTTSWSTRLIHGGLRYLEHGEIGLVRESLREREILLRIAGHLVKPLPFAIPFFKEYTRGPLMLRAGLSLYDLIAYDSTLPRHRILSPEEFSELVPGITRRGLKGGATYHDAQVEFPERLALENVIDARINGAEIRTYCRATRLLIENGSVEGLEFEDTLGEGTSVAYSKCIVNAAGPWVDEFLSEQPLEANRLIGSTKGSHLVVETVSGQPKCALYAEASSDRRPFFIIPWNSRYLIGTTDLPFSKRPDAPLISEAEIEYLMDETNRVLPGSIEGREQISLSYSGVRPLQYDGARKPGAKTRRHLVRSHSVRGLYSIVGGKLTTYRNLADEALNYISREMGFSRCPTVTHSLPLPGSRDVMPLREDERLIRVYGSRAAEVRKLAEGETSGGACADVQNKLLRAEIEFAFNEEFARTLTDFMMRRSMLGLTLKDPIPTAAEACQVAAKVNGWTREQQDTQFKTFESFYRRLKPRVLDEQNSPAS